MRKEYDLSKMKWRRNPYIGRLKQQVTIRLRRDTVQYFKELARETGMKYQNLIDLYLADCVESGRRPTLAWDVPAETPRT
jgi:uncharacterized protein (DUF4415 family)